MNQAELDVLIALAEDTVEAEGFEVERVELVGSTYITGAGQDVDILVLVEKQEFRGIGSDSFEDESWQYGGYEIEMEGGPCAGSHWGSWKKTIAGKVVNLLVTDNEEWFGNFIKAADICYLLHKMSKPPVEGMKPMVMEETVRYAIHNILMDDSTADVEIAAMYYLKEVP